MKGPVAQDRALHPAKRCRVSRLGGTRLSPPTKPRRSGVALVWIAALCALPLSAAAIPPPPSPPPALASSAFDRLIAAARKSMMADPLTALQDARKATGIAQSDPRSPNANHAVATGLWLQGEALTRVNRVEEARAAIAKASALAAREGKLTKLSGDLALAQARIAGSGGDFAGAIRGYQQAHAVFQRLGILRGQSMALQGLGSIYDKAHDFPNAIRYYRESSQVYSADPALTLSAANNLGFALQQVGRYTEAEQDFEHALGIAAALKSGFLQAQILGNLADVQAKQRRFDEAERNAERALKLLGRKDELGGAPFVWGVKAAIEYQRGHLDAAAADLDRAFGGVDLATTLAPFRDMHEIAYKVYRAKNNYPLALAHLEAFKRLDDEGRSVAASANVALTGARFDFTRQKLEIEQLRSTELQRDIRLRQSQEINQTLTFAAFVLGGALLIGWLAWRAAMLRRHRNAISEKNTALTKTLAERDGEIARRVEIESQLRLAMETAQQASRAKSHFLANMSHELRTPLNAVIGFSEIIAQGKLPTAKCAEYAADICSGGRHLLSILNDILDMARIESGKVALAEEPVPFSAVVEHALSVLGCEKRTDHKQVRLLPANGDLWVRGDELRLRQIAINLISNALKFTAEDGLVEVAIERTLDGVDLMVRDNGSGIPPDKLHMIMEPFGQAESTYARVHGGVGLGLPIVKSLTELHGGRLSLTSDVGKGTVARVHLPLERVVEAIVAAPQPVLSITSAA